MTGARGSTLRGPAWPVVGVLVALALPSALGLATPALDVPDGLWLQAQRILPGDASDPGCWGYPNHAYGKFGYGLAADGDLLAVGMRGCNPGLPGAVYLYERTGGAWLQHAKLQVEGDRGFGVEVDLDGDVLVVGAPYARQLGPTDHGAAYVFERAGGAWELRATLFPTVPQGWGYFGMDVAVSGDVIAVGANGEDGPAGPRAGAVYLYQREAGSWTLVNHIAGAEAHSILGWALDLEGDRLLVASRLGSLRALLAFSQTTGGWLLDQTILGGEDDPLAYAISIDGDTAIAGAPDTAEVAGVEVPFYRVGPVHTGRIGMALVLERGPEGWAVAAQLDNPRHAPMEWFGYDVALEGDLAVVGAPGANPWRMGAAYVYERSTDGWGSPALVLGDDTSPGDGVLTSGDDFGWRVALSGGDVFVSAPYDTNRGNVPPPLDDQPYAPPCLADLLACDDGVRAGTAYAFRKAPLLGDGPRAR